MVSLNMYKVPEYSPSLDEEGVCKAAFELIFAFDEAISLGNKENVTVAQVKQYCEMESHEEKLHKLVMQSKINETKAHMRTKVTEIEKNKVCPTYSPGHTYIGITIFLLEFMQIERGKTENERFGPTRTPNNFNDVRSDPIFPDYKAKGLHSNKCMLCGNRNITTY